MEMTSAELKRWWDSKTKSDQAELLDRMVEVCDSPFAHSLKKYFDAGWTYSAAQLAALKKWDVR